MQRLIPNSTFMTNVLSNVATAKSRVSEIPDGTAGNSLGLQYINPINAATGGAASLNSLYNDLLGDQATTASEVGATYTVLTTVEDFLGGISTAAKAFVDSVQPFKDSVSGVKDSISGFSTTINDAVNSADGIYTTAQPALDGLTIGVSVFFGVVIGFCVLGILGCLLMTFCDKFKCRYLIYFACVILFIIAIIGFILSIMFSVITPAMFFAC